MVLSSSGACCHDLAHARASDARARERARRECDQCERECRAPPRACVRVGPRALNKSILVVAARPAGRPAPLASGGTYL